jgi:adenosylcobinamide-phosphate synthase
MPPERFLAATCLDWLAGDPNGLPHPVRFIGRAISTGERFLRRPGSPANEMLRGATLTGAVVGVSWVAAKLAMEAGGATGEILLAWTALATRSLLDEARGVLDAVDLEDLVLARIRLAMIVGRDTDSLDEPEILRAVIETVAEGLCDGVVAPILYLALGGVPLAFAYKAINTLDSMIGHPEPPYRYFGRVAARCDDVANFVPARVAAVSIVAAAFVLRGRAQRSWLVFRRDGSLHASPNAGQPEAAMAGALGVRLGGVNYYSGTPSPKPVLGSEGRRPTREDARCALRMAAVASLAVSTAAWLWLRWRRSKA